MSFFLDILISDLKDHFKRVSTYIYFVIFFAFALILVLIQAGVFPGSQVPVNNRVDINSPYNIQLFTLSLSIFSVFVIAPIFGQNAFKDHLFNFNELSHSKSFSRTIYCFARYLSACLMSFFILSSISLGSFLGAKLPLINSTYLGEFQLLAYLNPYLTGVFPNLIVFGGFLFVLSPNIGKMFGTPTLPVTYKVIEMLGGQFFLFILIILSFWSGEMLWKERTNHFDEFIDASPVSLLLLKLPKLIALNLLLLVLFALLTICGIIIQVFKGYYDFEVMLYVKQFLFIYYPIYFGMSCISFLAHCLINNKFIAHGAMILYYVYFMFGTTFGIERSIFILNKTPPIRYSAMNGFGPNLYGHLMFSFMWIVLSIAFVTIAVYLSQRGKDSSLKSRLTQLKSHFKGNLMLSTLSTLALYYRLLGIHLLQHFYFK